MNKRILKLKRLIRRLSRLNKIYQNELDFESYRLFFSKKKIE